jgi:protoporphyrin/coproporphyrin ferrochelatase
MLASMNEASPVDTTAAAALPAQPSTATVPEQSAVAPAPTGVLLVNLGTPDTADVPGLRRYLKEFLSDPRVIEDQGLKWQLVLNGIVLTIRPRIKARDYRKIWNNERNESPLKTITRAQTEKLASELAPLGAHIVVDWAMRYGNPSIESRIAELAVRGCDRLLVVPLYPQYSAATTASVGDEVFRVLMGMRRQPAVRLAAPYYDDPLYIEALAATARGALERLAFTPDVVVASYHGMPEEYVRKGDPYERHCIETTRLLRAALGYDEQKMPLTFQSRFGRTKWLGPATDATVKALGKSGVKNLAVIMPGFSADCLETLEEIAVEVAHIFRKAGGENFCAIPCLNDSEPGMRMLKELTLRELRGWVG